MIRRLLLGAPFLACASASAVAATLSAVPMQGGMVMPMLSYSAGEERLHVTMDAAIPQLTPLLVSHPGDQFDPADPWFEALDPSREGRSFSRRYGFVIDALTDPLPPDREIWIRKLSGSSGLSAYRYSNTEPKIFEPVFGTDGVTNALHWNGLMFHPVFTAPPGTNSYTATFEAFVVDTTSGLEVPDSSTGPFVFNWTNVPDGRPELVISQGISLSWPASATNYVLEGTDSIPGGTWTLVTNLPVNLEGRSSVTLEANEPRRFFRMRLVP